MLLDAILRKTLHGTSYKTIRLVFRPYTMVQKAICTSAFNSTSTTVSHRIILPLDKSSSFGTSQLVWLIFQKTYSECVCKNVLNLSMPYFYSATWAHTTWQRTKLLDTCFKTSILLQLYYSATKRNHTIFSNTL